jgi:hypothetical protein
MMRRQQHLTRAVGVAALCALVSACGRGEPAAEHRCRSRASAIRQHVPGRAGPRVPIAGGARGSRGRSDRGIGPARAVGVLPGPAGGRPPDRSHAYGGPALRRDESRVRPGGGHASDACDSGGIPHTYRARVRPAIGGRSTARLHGPQRRRRGAIPGLPGAGGQLLTGTGTVGPWRTFNGGLFVAGPGCYPLELHVPTEHARYRQVVSFGGRAC